MLVFFHSMDDRIPRVNRKGRFKRLTQARQSRCDLFVYMDPQHSSAVCA
jgi:hypothetical protein